MGSNLDPRSALRAPEQECFAKLGTRLDHCRDSGAGLMTRRQRPRCRRAPVSRSLWAGSTRVNLERVCGSPACRWGREFGRRSGRSRIAKTANLDSMELMGQVWKGDGDDGYG